MKFSSIAFAALFTGFAIAAPLVIDTPVSVVAGEPTLIDWSGGEAPYLLLYAPEILDLAAILTDTFNRVNAANEPSAAPLENLGIHSGTSFTWNTNLAAGTAISFEVRDKADDIAQSAVVVIQ